MCGLGSITFTMDAKPDHKKFDGAVSALIAALDHRGKDACGYMSVDAEGVVRAEKAPMRAKEFNSGRHIIAANAMAVAVHTRFSTKGLPAWNQNNHPVAGGNGVLVMHNGVVYDSDVTRAQGDPVVDTFALAQDLGKMRTRHHNEKDVTFMARIARTLMDREGSQTAQVMIAGQPFLFTARIRSNPLYEAEMEAFDGHVRVTASTFDAVKKAIEALGLEVPSEMRSITKLVKGRQVTTHQTLDSIFTMQEGEWCSWNAGTHNDGAVEVTKEPKFKRQSYSSYVPPRNAATRTDNAYSGKPWVPGQSQQENGPKIQPKFRKGDVVKLNHNQLECVVADVLTIEGDYAFMIDVPEHQGANANVTIGAYTGRFLAQNISLVRTEYQEGLRKRQAVKYQPGDDDFCIGDRVRALTSKREGVIVGISMTRSADGSMIYDVHYPEAKNDARKGRRGARSFPSYDGTISGSLLELLDPEGLEPIGKSEFDKIVDSLRKQDDDLDLCEICNTWTATVEVVEDVTLCPNCAEATKAWDNAGLPKD
jgi:hypothetical protein